MNKIWTLSKTSRLVRSIDPTFVVLMLVDVLSQFSDVNLKISL